MTVYAYSKVAVYAELGGALRLARGARVFVTDPTTGAPVDATQGARTAPYVDADASGDVTFTAESWPVRLTSGATYEDAWPIDAAGPDDATVAGLVGAATATRTALDGRYVTDAEADATVAALIPAATATRTALDARFAQIGASLVFNVRDYGAVGDGVTDDTAEIQAAITAAEAANRGCIYLPAGVYQTSSQLTISGMSIHLMGAGVSTTYLRSSVTTGDMVHLGDNAGFATVSDMTITRSTRGTAGCGISAYGAIEVGRAHLHNLHITQQYRGMYLGPTSYGWIDHVSCDYNALDGIYITNSPGSGVLQWDMSSVGAGNNGRDGIRVQTQATGPSAATLGQWSHIATFGNTGIGIAVLGVAGVPVSCFRLSDSFLGEDGGNEIYLDTYGSGHVMSNVNTELVGVRTTGPDFTTPATNTGHGMLITASNGYVSITGGVHSGHAYSAIYTSAANTVLTGVWLTGSGRGGAAGAALRSGVYNAAGRLTMSGCRASAQLYGAYTAVDSVLIVGCDLQGNTTAAVGNAVALTVSVVASNRTT